jgi:regulator of cell morphogenesis and NO signaling
MLCLAGNLNIEGWPRGCKIRHTEKFMQSIAEKSLRELALEKASAARVFEKLGLDYCCGGDQSLKQACQAANLPMEEVLASLEAAERDPHSQESSHDWRKEPLSELVAHINSTHHVYTRAEIARLVPLFDKVCSVHAKNHPELLEIRATFFALAQELSMHLMKEEKILFPFILRMEESAIQKEPLLPAPFGTVQNPVSMMVHEHDSAGNALRAMRKASQWPRAKIC